MFKWEELIVLVKMKKGNHFDTLLIIVGLFSFLFIFGLLTTISQKPFFAQVVEDDTINDHEMMILNSLDCDELKEIIGTEREVCVYFKDENGNVQPISGCPGVYVDGLECS